MAALVSHTVIVCALIGAYIAVTLAGMDGTPVLTLTGGYLSGAAIQRVASQDKP